tara:strand:+ start:1225 stop:1644 length:420 start_codon:yes stop_codon:yes gene_type:complete
MDIQRIQYATETKDSVFINGDKSTCYPLSNGHIKAWLLKAGAIIDNFYSQDTLLSVVRNAINEQTSKRILEPYPDYKQRNIDREALLFQDNDEKKLLQVEMHNYITSIITKGKDLKASLATLSYEELSSLDVTSDSYWS